MRDGDGDVYLQTRAETGLLAQMTETPVSDWTSDKRAVVHPIASDWRHHGQVVHVFTHFRVELEVWSAVVPEPRELKAGWWADPRERDAEALPSVFRKVLAAAGLKWTEK